MRRRLLALLAGALLWLDRHWLRGVRTEAEMAALLREMSEAGVQYLFIHAGPFSPDGTIPLYEANRVAELRRLAGGFTLVAWLGARNAAGGGDVDLTAAAVRQRAVKAAQWLVAAGFDGVQLNVEPTPDGDPGFLLLLSDMRAGLPAGAFLGAATNLSSPVRFGYPLLWSPAYLAEVARRVDQIAVMNYDTYMPTPALYRRAAALQTRWALSAAGGARVLMGVPAYPSEGGLRHRDRVESPAHALAGIAAGLSAVNPAQRQRFEGVAIYAGWTALPDIWQQVGAWVQ